MNRFELRRNDRFDRRSHWECGEAEYSPSAPRSDIPLPTSVDADRSPRPALNWFVLAFAFASGWNATYAALWAWHRGICIQSVSCAALAMFAATCAIVESRKTP